MKKIRKCVIPAAGMGTRFLPATKALPKEMFPVVDKPVMQYLVEEAIAAGCEEIIIVTGRSKRAIEDHFDSNPELETRLDNSGKFEYLKKVQSVAGEANIVYVRQPYPKGDGDALLRTKNLIGDEPFLVLFGDDLIDNPVCAAEQLVKQYQQVQSPIMATVSVQKEDISQYGIVEGEREGNLLKISRFLEKPQISETDSTTAVIGKYILTPDVFGFLENAKGSVGDGEIRLADAFISMQKHKDIYGFDVEGTRYDTGNKLGYLQASIAYALKDENMREDILQYIKTLSQGQK
ncbi:UTP--glucose-1-phosphate uridylyltransferase [Candidatus Gracilibacteria bacterium]|nr:UTP--glucose-1-phosphate uridylyltransferase [Candidatus Gracilibacteria bacterium]